MRGDQEADELGTEVANRLWRLTSIAAPLSEAELSTLETVYWDLLKPSTRKQYKPYIEAFK